MVLPPLHGYRARGRVLCTVSSTGRRPKAGARVQNRDRGWFSLAYLPLIPSVSSSSAPFSTDRPGRRHAKMGSCGVRQMDAGNLFCQHHIYGARR